MPRAIRQGLAVVFAAVCVGPFTVPQPGWSDEPAVTITVTRNFYGQEMWDSGKQRRWMSNMGEIELQNAGPPVAVDLRFAAESFRATRRLTVIAGGAVAMAVMIPPAASRYVVVKHLQVPAGKMALRFEASPGPARAKDVLPSSSDPRELSVAFGPFSTVASASPEGQIEQTGAFPEASWHTPTTIWDEEPANDLRRQGRLVEALVKYRALIAGGRVSQPSYLWAGLCAMILGAPDDARALFRSSREGTVSTISRGLAARIANAMDEFVSKSQLIRRADPVARLRTGGEIYLAVPEYGVVLRAHPDDAVANFWLGAIYVAAERAGDARTHFERIVQAYPKTYEGQFLRSAMGSAAP